MVENITFQTGGGGGEQPAPQTGPGKHTVYGGCNKPGGATLHHTRWNLEIEMIRVKVKVKEKSV